MVSTETQRTQKMIAATGVFAALALLVAIVFTLVPQAVAAKPITQEMIKNLSDQTYTGNEIKPYFTVEDGGVLVEGTDYTFEFADNINVSNYAKVIVHGKGNYTGDVEKAFSIVPKNVGATDVTVTDIEDQTYTGAEIEPELEIKYNGQTLVAGTDYDVTYTKNVDVSTGEAKATVTGKGNYTGTTSKTFKIEKADIADATITAKDQAYTGSPVTTTVTVTLGDVTLKEGTDFVVEKYYNNTEVGTATVLVKAAGSNIKGDAIGTFYVTEPVAMNRLYNPNSGEHFYTASVDEKDWLVGLGWNDEGIGWMAPSHSATPVFRLYNEIGGEHHYTMEADERDALIAAGWKDEGTGWYSDDDKTTVLYREYNPNAFANNHNYTADKAEHDELVSLGWNDEGTAWYGLASA